MKQHKFFDGIDFKNLHKIDSPFKINQIQSPSSNLTSTKNPSESKDHTINNDDNVVIENFALNMNYFGENDDESKHILIEIKEEKNSDVIFIDLEQLNKSEDVIFEGKF